MKRMNSTTVNIPAEMTAPLLAWYRDNARDLPWRHTRDPYRIWVSEIMLQQTRVAAVLGYYARFLEVFPTVEALAAGDEERLLKLWEGLGYYSRARNLQKAAAEITMQGGFPDTREGLLALPGIGDYTASAIASAAFGRREPAVDGNVLRVMTRLTDCHEDILAQSTRQRIRAALEAVMPTEPADIRIFNQAMMELGATVCGPNTAPRCDACPVQALCLGCQRGTAEALPVKKAKKARRVEEKTVFLLMKEGRIALRKRRETGLLAGLWEFPNVEGTLDEAAFDTLCARASRLIDRHTFGRAEPHARACAGCAALLADACVQIVDAMSAAQSACAVPGASSVSNDGYSVTFASGALSERLAAEAQGILSNTLGNDPHGLLYRGCF